MSDPDRKPLQKQPSKTSLEQSLRMIPPPQQAPITIYPGPSARMANLSKADLEIAQRLENLRKDDSGNLPTEEEMATRLAQLKGLPSDHYARASAAGAAYQPPDQRSDMDKTQDLLSQIMGEVAIDSHVPNPDDELQARLARLRGEEPSTARPPGAVALPPAAQQFGRADVPFDDDLDDISLDEVEALMQASSREDQASANRAMGELQADPELAQAVAQAQATRKKEKKGRQKKSKASGGGRRDSSDDERRSKSYDSDIDIEGGKAIDAVTDQAEVQRIIDMYTKRAQLKKERKRKKKEAAAAAGAVGGAVGGDDSDSDISSGSDSDLTSESEKFSESDELSD